MDGGIVNPGDLDGRVLPANEVDLCRDGNQIFALACPDLVVGVSGFGDSVVDALRDLADNLEREAVWIDTDRAQVDEVQTDLPHAAWGSPSALDI